VLLTDNKAFYIKPVPEKELNNYIESLHKGDEKVIQALYASNYRALCYLADKLIHNKEEAEDIATDTFLKFLKKRLDFDNYRDIRAFLFTATRNACVDYLRKMKRRENAIGELNYLGRVEETFGFTEMLTAKVLQVMYADIEALPEQCKKIFKSFFFDNKTTAIIASDMEISPQTVLNQKNKAIRILRMGLLKKGLMYSSFVIICLLAWSIIHGVR